MAFADPGSHRSPATAAAVVVAHAAVVWLVATQSPVISPIVTQAMEVFEVPTPAPPVAPSPEPAKQAPNEAGEASAANKHAKPTEVVAPKPVVKVETPPPIVAAPVASSGREADAGATPVVGPGTGAGGVGQGLGSGGQGTGTGGGGGSAYWVSGRIRDRDYPRAASKARAGGAVVTNFEVGTDGRVSNCRVVQSSGRSDLDATTCALIEKRFRYKPALDANGRPVRSVEGWRQTWWLEPR
ncbi:energy transducer TonB [Sphingoaurantiacus capsulatus]|uniref:Energy transducer TonB n=1 Tax=Sphingoaurantiacus capsulatus TaxID=1771310 RepID=A0ABV7X849_9SPHN